MTGITVASAKRQVCNLTPRSVWQGQEGGESEVLKAVLISYDTQLGQFTCLFVFGVRQADLLQTQNKQEVLGLTLRC